MTVYKDMKQLNLEPLSQHQYYIYAIENTTGYIKVGISHNIRLRAKSLSGSNGGGNKIKQIAVSEPTWLYTMEKTIHVHFQDNRILHTEWFKGLEFSQVISFIDSLFAHPHYQTLNKNRRDYITRTQSLAS